VFGLCFSMDRGVWIQGRGIEQKSRSGLAV
jgi:hypothetical protein